MRLAPHLFRCIAVCLGLLGNLLSGSSAFAQVSSCGTPGLDGPSYSAPSYYPGAATASAGQPVVQVGAIRTGANAGTAVLAPGDLVMVIQMQDALINNANSIAYGDGSTGRGWTDLQNAGVYEFRRVASVAGTNITLDQNLGATYTRAAPSAGAGATENGNRRFQVIRVPQFSNVTLPGGSISPPDWNGETGGVAVLDVAGTLNMNGTTIDVSRIGFRGAGGVPNSVIQGVTDYAIAPGGLTANGETCGGSNNGNANNGAFKGEGISGTPRYIRRQSGGTLEQVAYGFVDLTLSGYPANSDLARGAPGNAGGVPNAVILGATDYAAAPGGLASNGESCGGDNTGNANNGAFKGEGISGTPRYIRRLSGGTAEQVAYGFVDLTLSGYPANSDLARGAPGNAGGGGTQHNAGGGGGSNVGQGGLGGNSFAFYNNGGTCVSFAGGNPNPFLACNGDGARAVGGLGGATLAPGITRLLMGGGGGAGDNNNACDNITVPQAAGGNGGGIIFIRAGAITGGGNLLANGQNGLPAGRDAAGGGGAGGTIVVLTGSTNPGFASVVANGGEGGNTGWNGTGGVVGTTALRLGETQGPGGGGGGGAVVRSSNATLTGVQVNGGASGAVFPSTDTTITNRYGSGAGGGSAATTPFAANTSALAGNCLPQLQTTKLTTTPLVAFPASNTAVYVITLANSGGGGGAAGGVTVQDTLQAPFSYTPTLAPLNAIGVAYAGGATGPASPTIGSGTRTVTIGTPGSNSLVNAFLLPNNATVSFTLTVVINGEGVSPTLGNTYQNTATVSYLDPLRNAPGTQVSPGGTYAPGGAVPGSNYASGSTTNEDVKVTGGTTTLSVTKSNGLSTVTAGSTTSYTLTFSNTGGLAANNSLIKDNVGAGLVCTSVTCSSTAGGASCPTGLTLGTATASGAVPNLFNNTGITIANFPAASSVVLTVNCGVTATGQ